MKPQEWHEYRDKFDLYFQRLFSLMSLLWDEYVSPMLAEYPLDEIKDLLDPEIKPLRELCFDMLAARGRLEEARRTTLKVRTDRGDIVEPVYFRCVFSREQWPRFEQDVRLKLTDLEGAIAK